MDLGEIVRGIRESSPGSREFAALARTLGEAAFSSSEKQAEEATRTIFADLVEPWADSFLKEACERYVHFMSEVIYAPGSPIVADLGELGCPTAESLRERYRAVADGSSYRHVGRDAVKRVVVLSRVTLGADIAVTATMLECAMSFFRDAGFCLIGPQKNVRLLGAGSRRVQRVSLAYSRRGSMKARLLAWRGLRDQVRENIEGLELNQWLVVDPDSRLTQLGLLPLVPDERYCFWQSRSENEQDRAPIGVLAAAWCNFRWLAERQENLGPWMSLDIAPETRNSQMLPDRAKRPIAAVSFGYGGCETKRLGDRFEDELLELLRSRGYRILLDYGAGEEEERLVDRRISAFAGSVRPLPDGRWPKQRADLMPFKGSLLGFGGWVRGADVFIGYDSAAGHLAAALSTPVIDIFVGAPSELMRDRWTPSGPDDVWVIPAEGPWDCSGVIEQVKSRLEMVEERRRTNFG